MENIAAVVVFNKWRIF